MGGLCIFAMGGLIVERGDTGRGLGMPFLVFHVNAP